MIISFIRAIFLIFNFYLPDGLGESTGNPRSKACFITLTSFRIAAILTSSIDRTTSPLVIVAALQGFRGAGEDLWPPVDQIYIAGEIL